MAPLMWGFFLVFTKRDFFGLMHERLRGITGWARKTAGSLLPLWRKGSAVDL